MAVTDAFALADGRVALTGFLPADVPLVRPGTASLRLADGATFSLEVEGESIFTRRPSRRGEPLPPNYRSLTVGKLPAGASIERLRDGDAAVVLEQAADTTDPPPFSEPARPIEADDVEAYFLRSGIGCESGENNLIYLLRSGAGPNPPEIWITWTDAGQELRATYRGRPADRAAIGGVSAAGITLVRDGFNRYSVARGGADELRSFLAGFGLTGDRSDRLLRASGIIRPARLAA